MNWGASCQQMGAGTGECREWSGVHGVSFESCLGVEGLHCSKDTAGFRLTRPWLPSPGLAAHRLLLQGLHHQCQGLVSP